MEMRFACFVSIVWACMYVYMLVFITYIFKLRVYIIRFFYKIINFFFIHNIFIIYFLIHIL